MRHFEIELRSTIDVELIEACASDLSVARAARVSTGSVGRTPEEDTKLISWLMKSRHGSPFEHNMMTFLVHAPIFVWREHMRHRIASYNEESARYTQLKPVFYVSDRNRSIVQEGKPGQYKYELGSLEQYLTIERLVRDSCEVSYDAYLKMLEAGISREVARGVLPVSIYSSAYVTMNARALMNFLSLRKSAEKSTYPSFPQREIEMVAEQYEEHFSRLMPVTYAAFVEHGRVSP